MENQLFIDEALWNGCSQEQKEEEIKYFSFAGIKVLDLGSTEFISNGYLLVSEENENEFRDKKKDCKYMILKSCIGEFDRIMDWIYTVSCYDSNDCSKLSPQDKKELYHCINEEESYILGV